MSAISQQKFLQETIDGDDSCVVQFHAFIMINSSSGSRHGKQIIQNFDKKITKSNNLRQVTHFYICDLYTQKEKQDCFENIKNLCKTGENVKIVIAGGDGTVQWTLNQAIQHQIPFDQVVFAVMPIGTGNDFAKSLGWSSFNFRFTDQCLQKLAVRLAESQVGYYDIWSCKIQCFQSGKITEIKNGKQVQLYQKSIQKSFTNYFGIGSDAKITYFAQKLNAKSVFFKKISYAAACLCSLLTPSKKIGKTLKQFIKLKQHSSPESNLQNQMHIIQPLKNPQKQNKLVETIKLNDTDGCITFLNSTVSMELQDIWGTPYTTANQNENENKNENKFKQQKIDDGNIEIVSYRNQVSIGLQRFMHMAQRVEQGEGPFVLNFVMPKQNEDTYIHMNGQPYKITNIKRIYIQKSKSIKDSRIRVAVKRM